MDKPTIPPKNIYTDASIKPETTGTIITTLRDEITPVASVAVVLTNDTVDYTIPVAVIQLYSMDPKLRATSYNIEIVGLAQATELTSQNDNSEKIIADSLSSVHHLNTGTKKKSSILKWIVETVKTNIEIVR